MTEHEAATDRDGTDRGDGPPSGYDVPPGATAYECPYCGAPFPTERSLTLHEGLEHADRLDEAALEAVAAAADAESADLHRFRLVALGALVALYFGFLFVYAVV